jgi:hypothetical protein
MDLWLIKFCFYLRNFGWEFIVHFVHNVSGYGAKVLIETPCPSKKKGGKRDKTR